MNILFVNNIPFNPKFGGIERVTDVLAKQLITQYGHNIYYLSFDNNCDTDYLYPAKLFALPASSNLFERRQYLSNLIEQYEIDIIVNQRGQFDYVCDVLNSQEAKIVNVIHSQPTAWVKMKVLSLYNYTPQTLYQKIRFFLKILLFPIVYYYIKNKESKYYASHYLQILNNYDALVLLSEKYKEELSKLIRSDLSMHTIVGIPNPNTFKEVDVDWKQKEKVILYVGRLDNIEKSPLRIIKIWKRLFKRFYDWKLILVGDGECLSAMLDFVRQNRIERVYFEGAQTNLEQYYQKASFICLTSNYEGWGMALTEGMQYGCVPVTFNNYGAASDIIEDGVSGCLIDPLNLHQYKCRLSKLMKDDNLRKKMGEEAIRKVRDFDSNIVASKWNDLFKKI